MNQETHYKPSLGARVGDVGLVNRLRSGYIPPQDEAMEKSTIGAMLEGRKYYDLVEDIVTEEMFYFPKNQMIFHAIKALVSEGNPLDHSTVIVQLTKDGNLEAAGGRLYIAEIIDAMANSANVEYYAAVVREKWMRRQQIILARELEARAYDETQDIFDSMDDAERALHGMSGSGNGLESATEIYQQVAANIEFATKRRLDAEKNGGAVITGISSGIGCIDRETGGWENTNLIILAGRPGMGKTHLALYFALAASEAGYPTVFFSLEMDKAQLVQRMLSYKSKVNTRDMRQGNVGVDEWKGLEEASRRLQGIWIDDTGAVSAAYVKGRARAARKKLLAEWKKKNPKKKESEFKMLIVIDYLQLMSSPEKKKSGASREQEVSAISSALKAIAKELKCPVIALSQLSRAVETRGGDKKPMLSDLRDSGSIEQDADMVMFTYRPEYYGLSQYEDGSSTSNVGEILMAKYRHGRVGDYKIDFDGRWGWRDPERDPSIQQSLWPDPKRVAGKDFTIPTHEQNDYTGDPRTIDDIF